MKLLHLRGENFRNIHTIKVDFAPDINIICGSNGSGKSTVLEMIYCLSRGRSFRTHLSSPIIHYEKDYCSVFGRISGDQFSTTVGFRKHKRGSTEIKLGYETAMPTAQALSRLLPVQLFHPESHDFLNGGPVLRRKFIDWGLFYTEPHFIDLWNRFHQTLKQRNAALSLRHSIAHVQSWDIELAHLGEKLSQYRKAYIDRLAHAADSWLSLFLNIDISMRYDRGFDVQRDLLAVLQNNINKDTKYGYTVEGPHRFDLVLRANRLAPEKVLSRGEQKRLICAFYLAQGQIFRQLTQKTCIYLLDDILSELDRHYQTIVLEALTTLNAQVFLTSLDAEKVKPLTVYKNSQQFYLECGILQP